MSKDDNEKLGIEGVAVTQNDIEKTTSEITGVDKDIVKLVFDTIWLTMCKELEFGNVVKLHGKGKFYSSKRSARVGRNPSTCEEYDVPEREVMAFRTSPAYAKKFRDRREELKHKSNAEIIQLKDYKEFIEK